ncbi:hypothetical protein SKAU_G00236270 [Synaphobranchus kaupii]|uniref:DUF4371 domain-containing protein n=1 Tax=Synaphobranchus kaupii TaxID=118154 RepID=A0A9Q1ITW0_SYNKA|nr:hypothetical protein SKAU_G00236270 [Synaphobranchus kaupii]
MTNIMHTAYYVAKEELPFTQFRTLHGLINRTGGKLNQTVTSLTKRVLAFEEAGRSDWKEHLVGFGSDGAAVNVGCRNSVAARLEQEVNHLVSIHCVAH